MAELSGLDLSEAFRRLSELVNAGAPAAVAPLPAGTIQPPIATAGGYPGSGSRLDA
jgi:hypothetical protein